MQHIESNLHDCLIEHLNVEIVLNTIKSISEAVHWLKSTFLYARILKNPNYYGIQMNPPATNQQNDSYAKSYQHKIDEFLIKLCRKNLQDLMEVNLIEECDLENAKSELKSTINGKLMARYCLAFETMKLILIELGYNHQAATNSNPFLSNEHGKVTQKTMNIIDLVSFI